MTSLIFEFKIIETDRECDCTLCLNKKPSCG